MKTPGGGGYGEPEDDDGLDPRLGTQRQQRQEAAAAAIASVGSSKAFMERGSVYEYRMAQESPPGSGGGGGGGEEEEVGRRPGFLLSFDDGDGGVWLEQNNKRQQFE
uniref:Uncharacterized protein n=1 Tax=Anopheles maculatus TaxID=74869 RepID=A0A182SK69_9DIPT